MGQEIRGVSQTAPLSAAPSVGRYLAGQRRLRRISLDELSRRTKLPLRSLERLEAGHHDNEADGFTRSFVRTVAEALGLDADDAVARLLTEPDADEVEGAFRRRRGSRLWWVALGATLLTAAGVWGVWHLGRTDGESPPQAEPSAVVHRHDVVRDLAESQGDESGP